MDFVSDSTADGCSFRVLTVIDTHTHGCLALEVERSMGASHVTAVLDRAIAGRGKSRMITCDNGTEFTRNHFDAWAQKRGIAIDFIQPGRPVENGFIESFNGNMRDECFNTNSSRDLEETRTGI